jgi:trimeric autotransporter adhesin
MKKACLLLVAAALCSPFIAVHPVFAQGTAFTYQGQLQNNGSPAGGTYNMSFTLFNTNATGVPAAGPVTNNAVAVSNGLFTVLIDFGAGVFTGSNYWLEIAVRTNGGGAFATLAPRQQLTPTPYAIYAGGANAAGINGTLPATTLGGTYSNVVAFNNGADTFDGTFIGQFLGGNFIGGSFSGQFFGDGGGLINLNASQLTGGTVPAAALGNAWKIGGNSGTTAGVNYVGTMDNQPLELHVNGVRALRLESTATNGTVNVIGGSPNNFVSSGIVGATIGGGGAVNYSGSAYTNSVTADFGTVEGGGQNTASGFAAAVAGGEQNTASGIAAFIGGGGYDGNTLDGNLASGNAAVVSGGVGNQATNSWATVGGGVFNVAGAAWSTVGGGDSNTATNRDATIAGGVHNVAAGAWATVGGGYLNTASGIGAFVGGGGYDGSTLGGNLASGNAAVVSGGVGNVIQSGGDHDFIGGGYYNTILPGAHEATIAGGSSSTIGTNDINAFIGGGWENRIQDSGIYGTIGGGWLNVIQHNGQYATIGGGLFNINNGANAVISGGQANQIGDNAIYGTVGGGVNNFNLGADSTIGGGNNNQIFTNASSATIGGGYTNTASGNLATIPGGDQNVATNNAFAAGHRAKANTIGSFVWADSTEADFASTTSNQFNVRANGGVAFVTGGAGMTVDGQNVLSGAGLTNFWQLNGNGGTTAGTDFLGTTDNQPLELHVKGQRGFRLEPDNSGPGAPSVIGGANASAGGPAGAVIGGGYQNTNGANYATIGGGSQNQISTPAANAVIAGGTGNQILAGSLSVIGGGANNTNIAPFATIPGGAGNSAGANAFAAGTGAEAFNQGSFVWADSSGGTIASTNNNSVTFRADGGYRLYSNGGATLGVFLAHNGNAWSSISDRDAKKNFASVDGEAVLEKLASMPVQKWNYKWEKDDDVPNIGPMAQDFKRAFYPGRDDKSITTLEFDGVELAAIQGLNEKVEVRSQKSEVRIQKLEAENAELRQRLEALEKIVLNQKSN